MAKKIICELCEEDEVTLYTGLGICNACYSVLYYWKNATPKRLIQRVKNLAKYSKRMDKLLGNIRVHGTGRKRKAA